MNTTTLKQLHLELERYGQKVPDIIDTLKFLEIVEKIVIHHDAASIPVLLKQFKDGEEYEWIFEHTKEAIEREFAHEYVISLISNITILAENAPEWACNFLFDIFKTPASFQQLKEYMHLGDQKAIFEVLRNVEIQLERYQGLALEIRKKLANMLAEDNTHV